jgi:YidC/Oxa1 family membrane protein insertase
MDKKSILAIVLCVIVIMAGSWISVIKQNNAVEASAQEEVLNQATQEVQPSVSEKSDWNANLISGKTETGTAPFHFETNYFDITFDPAGASVSSIKLKKYTENGDTIDLLFKGPTDNNAFLMYLGNNIENPITVPFSYQVYEDKVVFTQDFTDSETNNSFTIIKTFQFKKSDYLFKVSVDIKSDKPLDFDGSIYTLGFEPQIGPKFTQMKNDAYNYRRFYISSIKENGKDKKLQAKLTNGKIVFEDPFKWVDLTGKYFSSVAMPEKGDFDFVATESTQETGLALSSSYFLERNFTGETSVNDEVFFYCGPQLKEYLGSYYSPTANAWGLQGRNLDTVMDGGSWLSWLENALKWLLNLFYNIIPNYGVAIIMVTVFIKLLTYPLTRKSASSSAKMAALGPKMDELKVRYKDNPEKLNQATMALYKEEGVNPMGGCLPLLIQFPILIAFYGLLNKHFELRGAMFIPGWIPDLSIPDTVLTFGFNIPFIGNALHILPIIYTVSMIFSSKLTSAGTAQQGSMKFMTYGMPIIFFFVLYNAPSGLILYWTVQNGLSMLEQLIMRIKRKKELENPSLVKPSRKQQKEAEALVPEAIRKFEEKKKRMALEAKNPKKGSSDTKKNNK